MLIHWIKSSQGHNIARRFLALVITLTWLFMYLVATALNIAGVWATETTVRSDLFESAELIGERAQEMNGAMMLILAFYFAAPHMGVIVEKAMTKFSGKEK